MTATNESFPTGRSRAGEGRVREGRRDYTPLSAAV